MRNNGNTEEEEKKRTKNNKDLENFTKEMKTLCERYSDLHFIIMAAPSDPVNHENTMSLAIMGKDKDVIRTLAVAMGHQVFSLFIEKAMLLSILKDKNIDHEHDSEGNCLNKESSKPENLEDKLKKFSQEHEERRVN